MFRSDRLFIFFVNIFSSNVSRQKLPYVDTEKNVIHWKWYFTICETFTDILLNDNFIFWIKKLQ